VLKNKVFDIFRYGSSKTTYNNRLPETPYEDYKIVKNN